MAAQTATAPARGHPTLPAKCRRCDAPLRSPAVCESCCALFPAPHANYFELLGLPRQYAIDERRLRDAFRSTARSVHPDRFAEQPAEVRALATRLSADVNQAFAVLSDPVRRASYLLEMSGGPSAADMRDVPPDLLAEVMMIREEVELARSSSDAAALQRHRQTILARRSLALQDIAGRAERITVSSDEEKRELRRRLNSMKYFDNLATELAGDPLEQD